MPEQTWPTRLLHIGSSNSQILRLVETDAEKAMLVNNQGYAALSYCWGHASLEQKERICLSDENYARRLVGFSLNELPKTFRDAIQVTRSLGLSLLWIDALCINQTNLEEPDSDWSKESSGMQGVFSSALLTISATSASNWEQGFCSSMLELSQLQELFGHVRLGIRRLGSRLSSRRTGNFKPLLDNDFKRRVDFGPLNQRAWVLQERVLSRRLIHFSSDGIYWECGEHVRCDDFRELRSGVSRDHFLQDPEFPRRLTESGYFRTMDFLQMLFQAYARSGLSKSSDREVAISGLIKRMEDVWHTKCQYGIFEGYIHRLLLWRKQDTGGNTPVPAQDQEYRDQVPSWSWMVCSQIEFFSATRLYFPPKNKLHFDTGPGQEESLRVQIRELQECKIRQDGKKLIIFDEGDREVGCCWPDMGVDVTLKHCVVVAMDHSPSLQSAQGAQQPAEKPQYPDTHRTFFGNISGSDSEDEPEDLARATSPFGQQQYVRWQPTVLPSVSEHPALRSGGKPGVVEEEVEETTYSAPWSNNHADSGLPVKQELFAPPTINGQDLDSPTLGPAPEGLGSIMHHLRNKSNSSSNYPQDETTAASDLPAIPNLMKYESARQSVLRCDDPQSYTNTSNTNSNPWDLDDTDGAPYIQAPTPPVSGPNTPSANSPTPPPMPSGSTRQVPLRKKTVNKHEISEPVALLSSTSRVDTIDLPAGASLKNGMEGPPPLPPINPRRRATRKLFGMDRSESEEVISPDSVMSRSRTPEPWGTAASAPRSWNTSNPPQPFESSRERDLADVEKEDYYVLFVKPQSGENSFERIGAGKIKAHHVSLHNCEGRLV